MLLDSTQIEVLKSIFKIPKYLIFIQLFEFWRLGVHKVDQYKKQELKQSKRFSLLKLSSFGTKGNKFGRIWFWNFSSINLSTNFLRKNNNYWHVGVDYIRFTSFAALQTSRTWLSAKGFFHIDNPLHRKAMPILMYFLFFL